MGVWIETKTVKDIAYKHIVTPCVGVWIETVYIEKFGEISFVTPCVGVWIETLLLPIHCYIIPVSHPAWVCGLKLLL